MNDNVNQTGQNWTGRAPRTLREAFPRSIGGEWGRARALKEAERVQHRDDTLVGLILVLCFLGGCFAAPAINALVRSGWFF